MNGSEMKKLAQARNELLQAKACLEDGQTENCKLSVIAALCFIDLIYTLEARGSAELVRQGQ